MPKPVRTAKPRKYWVTEVQWAANHIALPLCKRHDLPFMFPVLVFPLSAAAHEERVNAVAQAIYQAHKKFGYPKCNEKEPYRMATAALAAISKEL